MNRILFLETSPKVKAEPRKFKLHELSSDRQSYEGCLVHTGISRDRACPRHCTITCIFISDSIYNLNSHLPATTALFSLCSNSFWSSIALVWKPFDEGCWEFSVPRQLRWLRPTFNYFQPLIIHTSSAVKCMNPIYFQTVGIFLHVSIIAVDRM